MQKSFAWGAVLKFYGGNFCKVDSINFWHKNVVRGNAVQICSDFAAKRLSTFLKNFSWHLFNKQKKNKSVDCFIVLETEIIT